MKTRPSDTDRTRGKALREKILAIERGERPAGPRAEATAEIPARIVAEFSAKRLKGNYEAIRAQVAGQAIIPMIKADAYGHGMAWAARVLQPLPDLYGFGVATLQEGADLRQALGAQGRKARIIVFSGCLPWSEEKGQFCELHGLTAVIASDADWHAFLRGGWHERIPYELKFNTGMNRLGINPGLASTIVRALRGKAAEAQPEGILSHLAIGETPDAKLSRLQLERFIALKNELAPAFPSAQFHLANSATIWNQKLYGLGGLTDMVRPGLSLYGVPPWQGAPERGLEPVMTLKAGVLAVHRLKPGESIGYGATFTVSGTAPVHAAVLSAGYADGLKRTLSNQGHAWVSGAPSRFLGIVSMDLCAVACTEKTKVGEWVELLGPHIDIWAQARAAGTIPYELLTSVSARVQRSYG